MIRIVIYKITNKINYKLYIGQTINYEERIRQHKQTPFRENSKEKDRPLYRAIRKYGVENFSFEIIDTAENIEELNKKEIYWIEYYDCCVDNNKGYNLDRGGKNGNKSEETKRKIGIAQIGELNHAYGKKGGDSFNAKRIRNVTDSIDYDSMIDCAIKEYGDKKYLKQLSKVCNPKSNRLTYKGKTYRLLDENNNIIKKENKVNNKAFSSVKIIEEFSGLIFNSISDCSKHFKISSSMIRDRIYNRIKHDKLKDKYKFKIYND